MREYFKREWLYLLLIAVLILLTAIQVSGFRFGFFTAYDEAYFLLKLQEAYDMSCITGKSQWNLIAIHWFPYLDLTSKVNSGIASSILLWCSILSVAVTSTIIFGRKRFTKYLALTWLFMFGLSGGLNYVVMQMAVLCWAMCAFMLFWYREKTWEKCLYAALCGVFLGLSVFIIIPAALVILASVSIAIIVRYWNSWREMLIFLAAGVFGVVITLLYIHFGVCKLSDIADAMMFTAGYIGKSGYNYDGISFLIQYGLFFRDCLFVILAFTGAYWLSERIGNKWASAIVYIAMILIYNHYQVKPAVTSSMFMLSVPLIPLMFYNRGFSWQRLREKDVILWIFLLLYPLFASFGTNTMLGGRIHCFISAWLFIWFMQDMKHYEPKINKVYLSVAILFIIPLFGVIKSYQQRDDTYHFTRGNKHFAEIALTEKQKTYFDYVYDILEAYDYKPKQSVVFTAQFDYCCLYAFDAVNSSNFHQTQNFGYFPKEQMLEPDFIFLCKWDSIVISDQLRDLPWGWPDEFDAYYVDTPEPDNASWRNHPELETRTLYCRRSRKVSHEPAEQ